MVFSGFVQAFAAGAKVLRPSDSGLQITSVEEMPVGGVYCFDRVRRIMHLVEIAYLGHDCHQEAGRDSAMRRELVVAKRARPSLELAEIRLLLLRRYRRSETIAEKDLHPVDEFVFIVRA
jgi:hypothetical protein